MRLTPPLLVLASASLIAVACSSSSSGTSPLDASADTGPGTDSGTDATLPPTDSGDQDTSPPDDSSGGLDAKKDTGPLCTGGTTVDYAGCVEADAGAVDAGGVFLDVGSTPTTITFTGDLYSGSYDPNCIKIKVGTAVTWSGAFAEHPLGPAPCNSASLDTIPSQKTGTASAPFTFTKPGVYGYRCDFHGGGADPHAMKGVIVVYP